MRSPAPLRRRLRRQRGAHRGDERAPRAGSRRAAGSTVERSGSYSVSTDAWANEIGGAEAGGMIGIAFDLGRAAFVALDQQARCATPPSVIAVAKNSGLPGDLLFGLTHVGNDQLVGLRPCTPRRRRRAPATRSSASGTAAADRVDPLGRVLGKLAVEVLLELGRLGDASRLRQYCLPSRPAQPRADRGRCQVSAMCPRFSSFRRIRCGPSPGVAPSHVQLPVAHRTAGHVLHVRNLVFRDQPRRRSPR